MPALTQRDRRPDKKPARMSTSEEASAVRPDGPARRLDRRHQRAWVPTISALLTLLIGLADIYTVFRPLPQHLGRLKVYVPGTVTNVTRSADVIVGLLLLLLAHGLRRRKKRAWQAVTGLLAFDCGIHFFHWHHVGVGPVIGLIIALGLLFILLYFREEFYAQGDLRNRWKAFWVGGWLIVADLAIGLGYIYGLGGLADDYSPWQRVQEVVYGLVGVSGVVQWQNPARADLFNDMTTALGLFTLIVTVYLFLRPAEPQPRLSLNDSARIRELLGKHGDRDSLGYFALRDDKSVLWSPTGKACICYRVVSGVMLASGDPIGDPEAWPGVIGPFLDEAARHAWAPAVMGCSELGAEVWVREGGLTALELGDEAIVEVADFSLSGRSMRNVRQMVSRVARSGYTAEVRRIGDIPRAEIDQIIHVADSWRGTPTERGFSMALGRIGASGDDDCVLVTAKQDGVIKAVLQLVPWGTDGLSLDLMRRDRNAQPGLNDFLIVETIKAAPSLGVKRLSLNFAVFRAALERGERIGAGPVLRAWRKILVFMSRWFQIESLYKFNAKFSPQWQPRFFVFTGAKDTPRVALAALEAEAFLVWPKVRLRRLGRQAARKLGLSKAASRLGLGKR